MFNWLYNLFYSKPDPYSWLDDDDDDDDYDDIEDELDYRHHHHYTPTTSAGRDSSIWNKTTYQTEIFHKPFLSKLRHAMRRGGPTVSRLKI